jgi:hypothetical protein
VLAVAAPFPLEPLHAASIMEPAAAIVADKQAMRVRLEIFMVFVPLIVLIAYALSRIDLRW